MTQEKYIGLENELTSFDSNGYYMGFNSHNFKNLLKDKYFKIFETSIRSNIGNGYYIDGSEIEIITPPITLNKGFATRLTNLLISGRNQVIKNTPHMNHTGYSMHWNLSTPTSYTSNHYDLLFYRDIAIPFQLFGLTPKSCGFNVKLKSDNHRFEIAGDSLTNVDQINATALLLGAYNLAKTNNNFPLNISEVEYYISSTHSQTNHMLPNGRYTVLNLEKKIIRNNNLLQTIDKQETQAQNILELFYDWLSPFVYKLGERDEINNLEAFVTGKKNLEIDDVKYFYALDKKSKEFIKMHEDKNKAMTQSGVYMPVYIQTDNFKRSQVLKLINQHSNNIPLEGKLWQESINKNSSLERTTDWDKLEIGTEYTKDYKVAYGIEDIYALLSEISGIKYINSLDCSNINPNPLVADKYQQIINKKIIYDPNKDNSAIVKDDLAFTNQVNKINNIKPQ